DRPHARGADLVDRLRRDLAGDPGLDLGLPRGDLALARLEHLAVDDALHLVGVDLGALESLRDRRAAEIGGIEGRETAAHLPEWGSGRGEDDRLRHLRLSSVPVDSAPAISRVRRRPGWPPGSLEVSDRL